MKGRILQSKWVTYGIVLGFIFLISSEAIPGNPCFSPEDKKGPVVRVKKPGAKISLAQQKLFNDLMAEGKKLLKEWMDYNGAIQKFQEAQTLAFEIDQKSDIYYYLSLAYFATLEERGEAEFIHSVEKLIETDYYRELDKNECSPRYLERFQEIRGRYGMVNILSRPSGADVYINNKKSSAGKTPLTYVSKAGKIEIKVQKDSKKKKDKWTVIAGKESTTPAYELKGRSMKTYLIGGGAVAGAVVAGILVFGGGGGGGETPVGTLGSIDIKSDPQGASIYLDNVDKGLTTPNTLTGISLGSHTVRLVLENYGDHIETVDVAADQTTEVNATLTAHTIKVTSPENNEKFARENDLEIEIKWEIKGSSLNQSQAQVKSLVKSAANLGRNLSSYIQRRALQFKNFSLASEQRARNYEYIRSVRNQQMASARGSRAHDSVILKSSRVMPDIGLSEEDLHSSRMLRHNLPASLDYASHRQSGRIAGSTGDMHPLFISQVDIYLVYNKISELLAEDVSNTGNSGSFTWDVGLTRAVGQYSIKVQSSTDSNVSGPSGTFEIFEPLYTYKLAKTYEHQAVRQAIGNFEGPFGLAVDSNFNIYIGDTRIESGNGRVIKLDKNGNLLTSWPAQEPFGIAVAKGFVYVAERAANRVAKYTSTGSFTGVTWKAPGGDIPRISPTGVALDSKGNVYILDYSDIVFRLLKYDANGNFIKMIANNFNRPIHLAINKQDHIVVADRFNHVIVHYDSNGNQVNLWNSKNYPCGIAVDSRGNVYVCNEDPKSDGEGGTARADKFSSTGSLLTTLGAGYGTQIGQYVSPVAIAVDKRDNIYVLDAHKSVNFRITKWSPGK